MVLAFGIIALHFWLRTFLFRWVQLFGTLLWLVSNATNDFESVLKKAHFCSPNKVEWVGILKAR